MRLGVFVGVSNYQDPRIVDLLYASSDAVRFLKQLVKTSDFSKTDSKTILSPERESGYASKENLITEIAKFKDIDQLDTFTFFFSGHGFRSNNGVEYLVPANATFDALEDTSIQLSEVIRHCCEINADNILVFIDACRDSFPSNFSMYPMGSSLNANTFSDKQLSIIFSTNSKELSYESDQLESGVFTDVLCNALEIEFDCFTIGDIYQTLGYLLPRKSDQLGMPQQHPFGVFVPEGAREYLLAVSKLTKKLNLPSHVRREINRTVDIQYIGDYAEPLIIDFGTVKSVLAYGTENGFAFATDRMGRSCIPSTVKFFPNGDYEIGVEHFSRTTTQYVKRSLLNEVNDDNGSLRPDHYALLIIQSLIRNFEEKTSLKARSCILSVPADYNILDVSRLVACAQAAGVLVKRIFPEPTAAALNILSDFAGDQLFDDSSENRRIVVVVDMGGGTLDVTFVTAYKRGSEVGDNQRADIVFRVFASSGEAKLGGIDFNDRIREYVYKKIRKNYGVEKTALSIDALNFLEMEIERAKIALSNETSVKIYIPDLILEDGKTRTLVINLNRKVFEAFSQQLNESFQKCVRNCIEHGDIRLGVAGDDFSRGTNIEEYVDKVIVAGQSGKMMMFKEHLSSQFPNATIIDSYSDIAVARGLAVFQYENKFSINIEDIAHVYVGIFGVTKNENIVHISSENDHVQIVYPTDEIPNSYSNNIAWPAQKSATVFITTNTIGKEPQKICPIEIEKSMFVGEFGSIDLHVDQSLTVVIEIRDFEGHFVAWQVNNFFRIPNGFELIDSLSEENVLKRPVRRNHEYS